MKSVLCSMCKSPTINPQRYHNVEICLSCLLDRTPEGKETQARLERERELEKIRMKERKAVAIPIPTDLETRRFMIEMGFQAKLDFIIAIAEARYPGWVFAGESYERRWNNNLVADGFYTVELKREK